ncbi:NAD(P) transhydrogenase subunit beta [Bifidobacterium bifidum]|nr:NAD(P) transhydrogenase subunit beta [Bifidobacterium bifidum]
MEVSYAIHPVAGRMPGHMNVLLAEANVPYEELVDLDEINPQFPQANVALVVGANDVTNPAARRPGTPVSGMPILDVDKSQNVVVMKRGRGMAMPASRTSCTSKATRRCCSATPRPVCRP